MQATTHTTEFTADDDKTPAALTIRWGFGEQDARTRRLANRLYRIATDLRNADDADNRNIGYMLDHTHKYGGTLTADKVRGYADLARGSFRARLRRFADAIDA
jgi:hypothetical protein